MTKTIMDLFEISEGKDLWIYLCDEETHKEFERQLLELAKEINIYDALNSRIQAYPICDEVSFNYYNLLGYFNLGGKSITRYNQCGASAFPKVLYVDFKKYMNGFEYPDYVMKEKVYEPNHKKVEIKIDNEKYKKMINYCVEHQQKIEEIILQTLDEKFLECKVNCVS